MGKPGSSPAGLDHSRLEVACKPALADPARLDSLLALALRLACDDAQAAQQVAAEQVNAAE